MRYFNIKEGSRKVYGTEIEVDLSTDLEKRVALFDDASEWEIKFLSEGR